MLMESTEGILGVWSLGKRTLAQACFPTCHTQGRRSSTFKFLESRCRSTLPFFAICDQSLRPSEDGVLWSSSSEGTTQGLTTVELSRYIKSIAESSRSDSDKTYRYFQTNPPCRQDGGSRVLEKVCSRRFTFAHWQSVRQEREMSSCCRTTV